MADRNPSPPRLSAEEIEVIQCDNIGETVFSKKWVLGTLMKLVQSVQTSRESSDESENGGPREGADESLGLNNSFEKELCELWDMSMNADVAAFLEEMETTEVLLDAILKSQIPRITEICVGILANMACSPDICMKMMRNKELINIVTALLDEPDAPVLVEVTRLMHVCVSNDEIKPQWMEVLETETVFKNFAFILENSLNVDLLTNCSQVVDKVLDSSDGMLTTWADLPLVTAVCETMKQMQMRSEQMHIVECLLHILQLVSTKEQGVQGLVSCISVVPLLCHFIAECGHDEGGIIMGRELSLTESFSVMNVILLADPIKVLTAMEQDPRITKVLMGLLGYSCKIHRKRSKSSLNRCSFSEGDEHKLDKSASRIDRLTTTKEENSTITPSGKTDTSTTEVENGEKLQAAIKKENSAEQELPDQTKDDAPCCSKDKEQRPVQERSSQETDVADIHHQYFTVATGFLKDIICESAKAPKCVSNMLAPHETLLQKIVHYASRITVYNGLVTDLVESTLSIPELLSMHKNLSERLWTRQQVFTTTH